MLLTSYELYLFYDSLYTRYYLYLFILIDFMSNGNTLGITGEQPDAIALEIEEEFN